MYHKSILNRITHMMSNVTHVNKSCHKANMMLSLQITGGCVCVCMCVCRIKYLVSWKGFGPAQNTWYLFAHDTFLLMNNTLRVLLAIE